MEIKSKVQKNAAAKFLVAVHEAIVKKGIFHTKLNKERHQIIIPVRDTRKVIGQEEGKQHEVAVEWRGSRSHSGVAFQVCVRPYLYPNRFSTRTHQIKHFSLFHIWELNIEGVVNSVNIAFEHARLQAKHEIAAVQYANRRDDAIKKVFPKLLPNDAKQPKGRWRRHGENMASREDGNSETTAKVYLDEPTGKVSVTVEVTTTHEILATTPADARDKVERIVNKL